ncbi:MULTISPECIES: sensor histidine kinase [Brevibacterium]|uniref:sensor histidine kinase n=1 Tax=Brevibacterium TaxID=1696 RepID=UPI0011BFE241|nr:MULTISPECIES: histidine kinase [Brevibacterium]
MRRLGIIWRRLLVLLIGGVVAVPYALVVLWILAVSGGRGEVSGPLLVLGTGVLVLALLCIPAVLEVTRALERTLAAQLLDIVIPTSPRRPAPGDRARGAAFYFGHAFAGGVLLVTLFFVLPSALVLLLDPAQGAVLYREIASGEPAPDYLTPGLAIVASLVALGACTVFIVITCYLLPHYALVLLGPSSADRSELERQERVEAFRRSTLAREVHDSIGHALTVTTMQAAVAKRLLRTDPGTAEAAVDEIARTGREAVAELDHVLALLRAEADRTATAGETGWATSRRTLDDIRGLAAEARSVGHPVDLTVGEGVSSLPPEVIADLHPIVREAMTNSLRHASAPGMTIALDVVEASVVLESANDCRPGAANPRVSGLRGIRERVEVRGGTVRWGPEGERWVLRVSLPLGSADRFGGGRSSERPASLGGRRGGGMEATRETSP